MVMLLLPIPMVGYPHYSALRLAFAHKQSRTDP